MKKMTWTCSACGAEHNSIAPPTVCGAIQSDGTTCDGKLWDAFSAAVPATAASVTLLTLLPDDIFRLLLDLIVGADPWPLANKAGSWDLLAGLLIDEAAARGFPSWEDAYRDFVIPEKSTFEIKPAAKPPLKAGIPEEFLEDLTKIPPLPEIPGFLTSGCLGCTDGIRIDMHGAYCGFGEGPRLPLDEKAMQAFVQGQDPYRHPYCPRNAEAKAWKKVTETEIETEKD